MPNTTKTVPLTELEALKGWAKLPETQQQTVAANTTQLFQALLAVSQAKLVVGEHLFSVQEILEPQRIFTKYLKTMFHMSKATAYRYIALYTAAKHIFTEPVLKVAMQRPDDRLTLKAIKSAPKPPKTANVVVINEYLDKLQRQPRTVARKVAPVLNAKNTQSLQRILFHGIRIVLNRIPKRSQLKVLETVVSMVLLELGVSKVTLRATVVPDSFHVVRGRPKNAVAA